MSNTHTVSELLNLIQIALVDVERRFGNDQLRWVGAQIGEYHPRLALFHVRAANRLVGEAGDGKRDFLAILSGTLKKKTSF